MHLQAETCWQAISTNDSDYDGQFVYAVKTTGIYCRPSCSSRLPNRENVEYYSLPAAAEAHGFRACKRCHPTQLAPQDEQAERVAVICAHIDAHLDTVVTLDELSAVVHWSPYHLQRTFKQVMGITPRQYAEAQRITHFKQQLKAGASVTEAALDAGYSSSSRIYAHADKQMGMPPSTYQKGGDDMTIAYSFADSSLGTLLLGMTERGVCSVEMGDDADSLIEQLHKEFPKAHILRDDDYLQAALERVLAYLEGNLPHIDLPLDIRVTAFQQKVLEAMQQIPYGETRSYADLARAVGSPKAARAVGQVCNKNPVPILIPCHRVVRSDGSIDGYAFGTERKKILLDMEAPSGDSPRLAQND